MDFDKKTFTKFRESLANALAAVEKEFDIKLSAGSISYRDADFNLRLTATKNSVNGVDGEQFVFNKYCSLFGLKPADFGKTITLKGKQYTVCGINMKRRRFPIEIKGADGKKSLLEASYAESLLRIRD